MKKQIALIIISLLAAMPAVAQNTNETYCNQNNTAENNFCFNGSQCFEEGRFPSCGFDEVRPPFYPEWNNGNICQKPPMSELPDIPEKPDSPETPEIPDIPAVPDSPEIPEIPQEPIVPELPEENLPDSEEVAPSDKRILEVLNLVNEARLKSGINALTYDKTLEIAAYIRSKEIKSLFSHTRPDGTSCFTVLDEVGYNYKGAGENIAYGQSSASEVFNDWMNSQGHRENIMNPNYTNIGMACFDSGTLYWAQMFSY